MNLPKKLIALKDWCLNTRTHTFIDRPPGMSEHIYFILQVIYYLHIECSNNKKPAIFVGNMFTSIDDFKIAYTSALRIITQESTRMYNPYLAICYINFLEYNPVWKAEMKPYESFSGNCQVIKSNVELSRQTLLF